MRWFLVIAVLAIIGYMAVVELRKDKSGMRSPHITKHLLKP